MFQCAPAPADETTVMATQVNSSCEPSPDMPYISEAENSTLDGGDDNHRVGRLYKYRHSHICNTLQKAK